MLRADAMGTVHSVNMRMLSNHQATSVPDAAEPSGR